MSRLTTTLRLAEYRFQDKRRNLYLIPVVSLLFGGLMLLADPPTMISDGNVLWSAGTFLLSSFLLWQYDWRDLGTNRILLLLYTLALAGEYFLAGIPTTAIHYRFGQGGIGKGVMMDVIVIMMPYVYTLTKLLMIVPLALLATRHSVPERTRGSLFTKKRL